MNRSERVKIYTKAQNLWGIDSQINVAIEEFGELITILAKRHRKYNGSTEDQIINEIADAKIMIEHLELIYGEERIEEKVDEKVTRLHSWLKEKKTIFCKG